jgi:hypothetical protein
MDPTSPVTQQPSLEDKILLATQEAAKIAAIFSPAVAQVITLGVSVEPVISGLVKLIAGLFQHHTGINPTGGTQ